VVNLVKLNGEEQQILIFEKKQD